MAKVIKTSSSPITRRTGWVDFRLLFARSADALLILDTGTNRFIDFNQTTQAMLRCPNRKELLSLHPAELSPLFQPDGRASHEKAEAMIALAMRQGSHRFEWTHCSAYRADFPVEVLLTPLLMKKRQLLLVTWRDITERKQAEARIRQQTEVLDRAPVAVVINDLANHIIYWNRGAEQLFGWTVAQALGRTAEELAAPETLAALRLGRAAVLEHGEWRGDVPLPSISSGHRIVELVMSLIRDEAGQPQARLTIGVDVTEKKKLEKQFLQVQRLENIGLLAAGIAHDLNNVLAPIIMATPLLRSHVTEPSGFKILELLEKSADRGTGLIRQILSFAHDSGGERTLVQLKHLLRDVSSLIQETFPKSIKFETEVPNGLWTVHGNPTQLHQIILNLCVNARDAMPQGGTLRLVAANRQLDGYEASTQGKACAGAYLALEVTDTGAGIAPDLLPRIWEPFFTTKGDQGTGLGLSTVNGIVHAHGGFITVESQVGCGSLFRVLLPAAEVEADPAAGGKVLAPSQRGQGELVLVVEDEVDIRDLVTTSLSQHGYRVLAAGNGAEAYALFFSSADEIKLVLTDLNMPELDGIGLVRDLQKLRPAVKILFMSGAGSMPQSELGESLPMHAPFLRKPFTVEALFMRVHETLAAPRAAGDR